jgi:hypothetical protein
MIGEGVWAVGSLETQAAMTARFGIKPRSVL